MWGHCGRDATRCVSDLSEGTRERVAGGVFFARLANAELGTLAARMPLEFPDWPLVGPNASSAVALLAIAVGLVTCFAGYRLFRVILALYGAALGAIIGVAVGHGAAQMS